MNSTFRLTNQFVIAIMISVLPFQSFAAVKMIADIGQPAPGFPEGFIYWRIDPKPAIGASGHIAFSGIADVSLSLTENSANAVWAGLPGQLRAIVRENEAVNGFPPNILFDSAWSSFDSTGIAQSVDGLVVTPAGAIGFLAMMKGAGQFSQRALLAHVEGTTYGVLRDGDPAPGFPAGTFINGISVSGILSFTFSDAGMVIVGWTTSNEVGVWLYDFNTITRLPSPLTGCNFQFPPAVSINQTGVIVLIDVSRVDAGCTPLAGIFKWQNGQWQTVIQNFATPGSGPPVPGMTQAAFGFWNTSHTRLLPIRPMIDDQGNVAFPAGIYNPSSIGRGRGGVLVQSG
ncbi:MAG: hypothetical protein IT528_09100 [Nitrosomonas sp.]|nr:hypothetical protein [Nitrosomonas sp.]